MSLLYSYIKQYARTRRATRAESEQYQRLWDKLTNVPTSILVTEAKKIPSLRKMFMSSGFATTKGYLLSDFDEVLATRSIEQRHYEEDGVYHTTTVFERKSLADVMPFDVYLDIKSLRINFSHVTIDDEARNVGDDKVVELPVFDILVTTKRGKKIKLHGVHMNFLSFCSSMHVWNNNQ